MTVARVPGRISIRSRGPLDELQSVVAASNEETCDDISYRFGRSLAGDQHPLHKQYMCGKVLLALFSGNNLRNNHQTLFHLDCLKRKIMSSSPSRSHGGTAAASNQPPPVAEPSFSEKARTLAYSARIGSLSTLSRKQAGFPFGSVMPYGLDRLGRPIFLISTMAMHTQNLQADPRASLLIVQTDGDGDPLGASRVTLLGNVVTIPQPEIADARKLYLERYTNSRYWVDFEDFSFYRMDVVDVYYVGGFGVMGWVKASDYDQSEPDPLAEMASGIIEHMNADHKDALILLARMSAGIESQEAAMTSVDRLGFHVRLKTSEGMRGVRIAFSREVRNATEARKVLVEMVQRGRKQP